MINAGAIVTSGLVEGREPDARFERIRECLCGFAGRELQLDPRVYASESATGHRNRALAYLTLATGALTRDVADATDVYFRQCSVLVTAADLAVMGATLANDGLNPVTNAQVVAPDVARTQEHGLHLLEHRQNPVSPIHEVTGNAPDGFTVTLRGEIDFIAFEQVVYDIRLLTGDAPASATSLTIDLSSVTRVGPAAARLFSAAAAGRTSWGSAVRLIDPSSLVTRASP